MQAESDSLLANKMWILTIFPKVHNTVGCKWVFCTKKDAVGQIVRNELWLMAKGYIQVVGVDFNETFTLAAKFIRYTLAIRMAMNVEIHQMHVKATLNGMLEVEIYMDHPKGFVEEDKQHLICKLKKHSIGISNHRGRGTTESICMFVKEGFCRIKVDHSLYIKQTIEYLLVAILHMDDLIILASNATQLNLLKLELEKEFEMSNLG